MIPEYEKRIEERKIIKKESHPTIILCLVMIVSIALMGLAAYLVKVKPVMRSDTLDELYGIVNVVVVLIFIVILGLRRSIYYSPKIIKEDFSLTQVLEKWRKIDTILLLIAEKVSVTGLVMSFLGMPFDKTFHFFLGTGLLMFLLAPMEIKVKSKISILRMHFPGI